MRQSEEMLKVAVEALEDKKAMDLRVIDIQDVSVIADYFVIASGANVNQVQALADNVEDSLGRKGFEMRQKEGYGTASWILMDYNDIIIHIFSEESRLFYDLERIWRDGKPVDLSQIR